MSISVTLIRTILDFIQHLELDHYEFLEQAGVDAAMLENPNLRIELPEYDRIQRLAVEFTEDPAFGLHMAEIISPSALNVVGHLFMSCHSAREALDSFFKYHRIISDCDDSELIEAGDRATVIYRYPRSPDPMLNRVRAEFGACQFVRLNHLLNGNLEKVGIIEFDHSKPAYFDEYLRIFGDNCIFDQPETKICFPRSFLDRRQSHSNPPLYELLQEQADRLLQKISSKDSLAQKIKDLVINEYQGAKPDMDTVAKHFNISARSLRRHLKENGYTYGKIIDDAQCEMAKQIFRQENVTIQEAGYRLGFSDVSSFHRAFKRWTGLTPQQYKSNLIDGTN